MSLVPVGTHAGRQVTVPARPAPLSRHGGSRAAVMPWTSGPVGNAGRGTPRQAASGQRTWADAAAAPGLSMENLLMALQRGTVPGADNNVAFLCQKYTALLERLKLAEDGERHMEDRCAGLDADLQREEAEEAAERKQLEAASASAKQEIAVLEGGLAAARCEEAEAQEELCRARSETEDFQRRRVALDEQCASERSRLVEVNSRFRQMQVTRPAGQNELRRLQSQLQTLTVQYQTAAEELVGHRKRAADDNTHVAQLKAEALSEEEARDTASELAARNREELNEALSELALLKEKLTETQVGVQRCEDELERRGERRLALEAEIQKYDIFLNNASQQMEDLHEVNRGLSRVQADTAEVRASISLEEAEVRSAEASCELKQAAVEQTERQLVERAQRLEALDSERELLQAEVRKAEEEQSQLEAVIEQLHHDQATSGGLRRNLEHETQLLLTEAERLRRERDVRVADRTEMMQRLRLLTPSLTETRRRVRELEDSLEAMRAEASRERQIADRLEREAGTCQDKMRVLRDQNVRLAEQCTELEAQLASASSRRPQALRARSTSACGVRTRSAASAERPRRGSRGPPASGRSTPIGLRTHLGVGARLGIDADLEDPSVHDVVLTGERPMHNMLRATSLPSQRGGTPMDISAPGTTVSAEFDFDGAGAARSSGTTPRDVSKRPDLQMLRDYIQSEEERLGVTARKTD